MKMSATELLSGSCHGNRRDKWNSPWQLARSVWCALRENRGAGRSSLPLYSGSAQYVADSVYCKMVENLPIQRGKPRNVWPPASNWTQIAANQLFNSTYYLPSHLNQTVPLMAAHHEYSWVVRPVGIFVPNDCHSKTFLMCQEFS